MCTVARVTGVPGEDGVAAAIPVHARLSSNMVVKEVRMTIPPAPSGRVAVRVFNHTWTAGSGRGAPLWRF
jgi:hypothetical protein